MFSPAGTHSRVKHCQPPEHHHLITHTCTGMSCHLWLAIAAPGMATGTAVRCWSSNTVPPADDLNTYSQTTQSLINISMYFINDNNNIVIMMHQSYTVLFHRVLTICIIHSHSYKQIHIKKVNIWILHWNIYHEVRGTAPCQLKELTKI